MVTYSNNNIYWNYFISIEEDLFRLSRFIEFDKDNENVFSIELARILISSSSEFEVVTRELCKLKFSNFNSVKMKFIRDKLLSIIPDVCDLEITVSRFGLNCKPLENWKSNKDCEWWKSYDKVKHFRSTEYKKANLINVINSIGALYIVNLYYYNFLQEKDENKSISMEETTLKLRPYPCLIKVNNPGFYMIPYNTAYYG